jgi:hypothetical protein
MMNFINLTGGIARGFRYPNLQLGIARLKLETLIHAATCFFHSRCIEKSGPEETAIRKPQSGPSSPAQAKNRICQRTDVLSKLPVLGKALKYVPCLTISAH